jgi:hypothetical protein
VALNPGGGLQQQTQAFANPPYFDNSDGKRFTGTVFLYKPQGNDGRPASTQTGECNLTFQQYGGVAK